MDPYKQILISKVKEDETNPALKAWLNQKYLDMRFSYIEIFRNKGFDFLHFQTRKETFQYFEKDKNAWLDNNSKSKLRKIGDKYITYDKEIVDVCRVASQDTIETTDDNNIYYYFHIYDVG